MGDSSKPFRTLTYDSWSVKHPEYNSHHSGNYEIIENNREKLQEMREGFGNILSESKHAIHVLFALTKLAETHAQNGDLIKVILLEFLQVLYTFLSFYTHTHTKMKTFVVSFCFVLFCFASLGLNSYNLFNLRGLVVCARVCVCLAYTTANTVQKKRQNTKKNKKTKKQKTKQKK